MKSRKLVDFVFETITNQPESQVLKSMLRTPSNNEYYPYIALDTQRMSIIIDDIIKTNKSKKTKSFCDAGCGIPVIPKIMSILGYESYGIEYEKAYCNYFGERGHRMIHGNILEFDFSNFDYVYSYNPIHQPKQMAKALENMLNTMKTGATLYFVKASCEKVDFERYGEVSNLKDVSGRVIESVFKIIKK